MCAGLKVAQQESPTRQCLGEGCEQGRTNLAFRMDAGTYYVLYNLRILISGLITQIIFRKALGGLKWFALVLLVVVPLPNSLVKRRVRMFSVNGQVHFGAKVNVGSLRLHVN